MSELQKKNIKKIDKSYRAPELIKMGSLLEETKGGTGGTQNDGNSNSWLPGGKIVPDGGWNNP